jgi:hypothetical protein
MNRDTALKIAHDGIIKLLYDNISDRTSALKDYNSFITLLTDLKQLFEAEDYIKENLK